MTLFWYIRTITQYVLVCTCLYYYTFPFLYWFVLGTYWYVLVPNQYILNTLFL